VICSVDESDDPEVEHTKTVTEYVPDGSDVGTKASIVAPAATVTEPVATWSGCPAELRNTANTIAVIDVG